MNVNRNLVLTLNCIVFFVMMFILIEELPLNSFDDYLITIFPITNFLTICYLITNKSIDKEDGLFSMWLKLKKKNIKDELEKQK